MDADAWAAIAAWAGFAATAGAGLYTRSQARSARIALLDAREAREAAQDQAHSARESALAARTSADAAVDSARSAREAVDIARKTYDREDEPKFEPAWEKRGRAVGVTLKLIDGPPEILAEVTWTSDCSWSLQGQVRGGAMFVGQEPGSYRVVRGESFGFRTKCEARADRGQITVHLFCRDADDESRTWRCPVVVDWEVPPTPQIP